jgi:hypothetical protein
MGVMFLQSTARLKDGPLSRADSRKAAKELHRRKQREFAQKLAKEAKVILSKVDACCNRYTRRAAVRSLFSLHLLFPHGYALDKIISNVFRGVTHLNFVTFANFCSNSFVSFNCSPLRSSVSLFMPIGKCSPAPTRPARLVVAAPPPRNC